MTEESHDPSVLATGGRCQGRYEVPSNAKHVSDLLLAEQRYDGYGTVTLRLRIGLGFIVVTRLRYVTPPL
jgi:hypothetical protein